MKQKDILELEKLIPLSRQFLKDVRSIQDIERFLPEVRRRYKEPYRALIYGLVRKRYTEDEAQFLWDEIVRHKFSLERKLSRNVNIKVAALDYLEFIEKEAENIQLIDLSDMEDLVESATRDSLTGLYSHGFFKQQLKDALRNSRRRGTDLSLILFDIDHFKKFNDEFGHQTGDRVLRAIAELGRDLLRTSDVLARYGGEEFAIILPRTDGARAAGIAERLRRKVEAEASPRAGTPVPVTISAGVAAYCDAYNTPNRLVAAADKALYRCKKAGRNCVALAPDSMRRAGSQINLRREK